MYPFLYVCMSVCLCTFIYRWIDIDIEISIDISVDQSVYLLTIFAPFFPFQKYFLGFFSFFGRHDGWWLETASFSLFSQHLYASADLSKNIGGIPAGERNEEGGGRERNWTQAAKKVITKRVQSKSVTFEQKKKWGSSKRKNNIKKSEWRATMPWSVM